MNGPAYTNRVREDFDRIADLTEAAGWDHNAHYHPFLLKQLPLRLDEALEVGCGTGAFARLLAQRCNRVVAVDLSPRMVEVARERSREHKNVEYIVADASRWEFPQERFDCVASIMTLHHLSLSSIAGQAEGRSTSWWDPRSARPLPGEHRHGAPRGHARPPCEQGAKALEDRLPHRATVIRGAQGMGRTWHE